MKKLKAQLVFNAVLFHREQKFIGIIPPLTWSTSAITIMGAPGIPGNIPDIISEEFRRPECGLDPSAELVEGGFGTATGGAVMDAPPAGKDCHYRVGQPVFEKGDNPEGSWYFMAIFSGWEQSKFT